MANLAHLREKVFVALPAAWRERLQNNFIQRCIAGITLCLVSLWAVWLAPNFFPVYVWFFILVAVREWQRMTEAAEYRESVHYLYSFIILFACVQGLCGTRAAFVLLAVLPLLLWWIAKQIRLARPLWFAGSIWYLGAPPLTLIALHQNYTIGAEIVTYFFGVVWATDTAAYLIGRKLGGALMAPDVSPKKTWSGFIAGLLAGVGIGLGLGLILNTAHFFETAGMSLLLSVTAQISDLLQSKIKRSNHIKDTGGIIPGHGGVLDRIDSLILSAPLYAFIQFVANRAVPW
jgi:phosphatidate cytidylyltransferase